ncbi:MAG TPA: gluconate 2-dehydrogenase subunit 3 family protein [Terriglobia bacterium]|nr:gluconate 2-dehydrogenase subunit 3 family protein [Terriglobia bacterium]
MNKDQDPVLAGIPSTPESGINRREMVRRLMLAGGAGFALPGIAEGHPIARHLANQGAVVETSAKAAKAGWAPAFLDQHQSETLEVLGERIIPGSSKAQVNRFIDLLLSVDTQDAQKKFLASLSAFEAESLNRFSHPYKEISETQQNEILTSASTAKPGETAEGEPRHITLRDHFENIKSWVAGAYYSSEIGMKELGWTGEVFFTSFPGCQESGDHHS